METEISHEEIERRKEGYRRIWEYQRIDHIPVFIWIDDFSEYSLREQCENGDLQLEVASKTVKRCTRLLPDDYIPFVRVWPGYITIATMFGMEVYWYDDMQAPGVLGHIIDNIEQVHGLGMPDPAEAGLMPHNLRFLEQAARTFPSDVYLTGIDLGGPLNSARDLVETNLLYTALVDSPDEMHMLLDLVTELQARCTALIVEAAGGRARLTSTDFDPVWAPEACKGFVSDDVCASFGPDIFETYSLPYNNRLLRGFRGARFHNCGPNPSVHLYPAHDVQNMGLNCSFRYSRDDIPAFKEVFRQRGIVEFNFDNGEGAEEIIAGYEEIANGLAPDVAGVPVVFLDGAWKDDDIRALYDSLRGISERYAASMDWSG